MAVYEGHIEIVEALLAVGADFDSKDMVGRISFHLTPTLSFSLKC